MRIDEYGHIIDDSEFESSPVRSHASDPTASPVSSSSRDSSLETHIPWYGHGGLYWFVTLGIAAWLAWFAYMDIAPEIFVFTGGFSSSGTVGDVANGILYTIGPVLLAAGSLIGCIWYNISGTKQAEDYYTIGNYFISPFCAAGGMLAMAVLIPIISIVSSLAIHFFIVILVIGGLISGG